MTTDNVIPIAFSKNNRAAEDLVEAIKDAFYSQAGNVTICEAFGCLELAKAELVTEILS